MSSNEDRRKRRNEIRAALLATEAEQPTLSGPGRMLV
jgi:hypothetical protein